MVHADDVERICNGTHSDPFAVLGPHRQGNGRTSIRAFLPAAEQVLVLAKANGQVLATLARRHTAGFFERVLSAALKVPYQLQVRWQEDRKSVV